MEPMSALIIACVIAWRVVYSAGDAAVDQAKAEAHQAASAIRDDLRRRHKGWADDLNQRLTDGRSGGPSTALWWGWAAARTARAVRQAMRRQPRTAEQNPRAIRATTGPFRRIWEAAVRGGRFAREEARRQRAADERQTRVPVGVCGRCGAVAARTALAPAEPGSRELLCANCRSRAAAERQTDPDARQRPEPPAPAPDVADADLVDPPQLDRPRPEIEPPPSRVEEPQAPKAPPQPTLPPAPPTGRTPQPARTDPVPVADAINPPAIEGEPVAPRQPGQVAVRHTATAARAVARGTGGESYTHGQWNSSTTDIQRRLEELPAVLELMLQRLTSADAGRSQVQGVLKTRDDIVAFMELVRVTLTDVNRRELPVLAAVEAAGGPTEIASISYLSDV